MQINSSRRVGTYNHNRPVVEGQQESDQLPSDPRHGDSFQRSIVNNLVSSPEFTRKALSRMSAGDSVTISLTEDGVRIANEGKSAAQKILDGGSSILTTATKEVARAMDSDPAFAFKTIANTAQGQVLANLDIKTQKTIEPFILPVLRGGMLAMDAKRAVSTAQNRDASVWEKGVDIGHVATDVVGFLGAIGENWIPALQPYSATLTGIGLVGDLAAVTFHAMGYLTERGAVELESMDSIFSSKAAKREAEKRAREEKANPTATV